MQDHIYDLLVKKDEVTWRSILQDLVRSGQINPWDIDISLLSQRYVEAIKQLQETNFFVSGKVLLACALLLKMKSEKLLLDDMSAFDSKLFPPPEDMFEEDMEFAGKKRIVLEDTPRLTIKTPQARKKQVTMNDLMDALGKALEVNERKVLRKARWEEIPESVCVPDKPIDITELIRDVFARIKGLFKSEDLTFTQLVPSEDKKDKLNTFVPLLYLENQSQIDLSQLEAFGEIYIKLKPKSEQNT